MSRLTILLKIIIHYVYAENLTEKSLRKFQMSFTNQEAMMPNVMAKHQSIIYASEMYDNAQISYVIRALKDIIGH